jgi:hypothetical protein
MLNEHQPQSTRSTFPDFAPTTAIKCFDGKCEAFVKEGRDGRMVSIGTYPTIEEAEQACADAMVAQTAG